MPPPNFGTKMCTIKRKWDEVVQDFRYQLQFGCIQCAPSVSYECQRLYGNTYILLYTVYTAYIYIYIHIQSVQIPLAHRISFHFPAVGL